MNIHLTAIDLHQHRIETWKVSIPIDNISYMEDVRWRGIENNYTRIYLKDGKSVVVTSSIAHIEDLIWGIEAVVEPMEKSE
jgi:hypothetical protein